MPHPIKIGDDQINRAKAIWHSAPADVTDEEYTDLYKHVSMDWQEPLTRIHIRAEGTLQFNAILFIPKNRPWQLDRLDYKVGVQLFQKGVKVLDNADAIVPRFLRFVSGVVDSPDLDLNVSREILQQTPIVQAIKKQITKKLLKHLVAEAKKEDDLTYDLFWTEFGHILKEGIAEDATKNKDLIVELLRFETTESEGASVSLAEIKEGMVEVKTRSGTTPAWTRSASSPRRCSRASPSAVGGHPDDRSRRRVGRHVGQRVRRDTEGVLTATARGRGGLRGGEKAKDEAPLITWMGNCSLPMWPGSRVEATHRQPIRAGRQARGHGLDHGAHPQGGEPRRGPGAQRVLEVNPNHPLVQTLAKLNNDGQAGLEPFAGSCWTASIAEGKLEVPKGIAGRLQALMEKAAQSMAT